MTYFNRSLILFLTILAVGCSKDSSDVTNIVPTGSETPTTVASDDPAQQSITLTAVEAEITEISQNSAKITWAKVTASNSGVVSYDVYINGDLAAEDLATTEFTVEALESKKDYSAKIVAKTPNAIDEAATYFFSTLGTPPSEFPLSYTDNGCGLAFIDWPTPTVADESNYSYEVYIDGSFEIRYGSYETERTGFNFTVTEGEEHTIKVVAISSTDAETIEEITFFQEACPTPADFEISTSDITNTSATLSWSASTMVDGSSVYYSIMANDVAFPGPGIIINTTDFELTGLERNTEYEVAIISTSSDNGKTNESTVTFMTSDAYPEHPTITVTEAILYTKNSASFAGQLNVEFTETLANFEIEEWIAADFRLGNFFTYTSSISSNRLRDSEYDALVDAKTGHVLIEQNGVIYQVNYTVALETR